MATNRTLTNAKEFVKTLDKAEKAINRQTLLGISGWMDLVRKDSVDSFMEKNKFASQTIIRRTKQGDVKAYVKSGNGFRRHDSVQKSVPNKLTIRTRRLASVVEAVGNWKVNRPGTDCKFTGAGKVGSHVLMWVRPQTGSYIARFTFGKGGDTFLNARLNKSKQRPFLQPSIAKNTTAFNTEVWKQLQSAANKTL